MENKVARTYLRRADFEQWGLSEGCPGAGISELAREDSKLTAKDARRGSKAC